MTGKRLRCLARRSVPQLDRLIDAARRQPAPVRAERRSADGARVADHHFNFAARDDAPETHRAIRACRRQPLTVWTECNGGYFAVVASQFAHLRAALRVP